MASHDQPRPVRGADFRLVLDMWCGMDEQSVAELDEITADSVYQDHQFVSSFTSISDRLAPKIMRVVHI